MSFRESGIIEICVHLSRYGIATRLGDSKLIKLIE